ncbi:MAG: HD-GYP domain-containing protein [Methylophilaceae bacterium]
MQNNQNHFIEVGQLRIGLFVHLDLGWMDHPFTVSNFKLKDEDQISKIKKIGLKKLRYDPRRSDCDPLPMLQNATSNKAAGKSTTEKNPSALEADANIDTNLVGEEGVTGDIGNGAAPLSSQQELTSASQSVEADLQQAKLALSSDAIQDQRIARLRQLHRTLDESEKKFINAGNTARLALKNMLSQPKQSLEAAEKLVQEMVGCALSESEIVIHAVNGNRSDDTNYVHSLNVTVLTLMMARSLSMSEDNARQVAMAALFHDIGKMEIPDKILLKKDPLTKSEQSYYEQHSEMGARIAKQSGMSDQVVRIILQHHECADSSGYPKHLKAEQTDPLARLVALINSYDNLCNPLNTVLAKTPYEALAHLFANQRSKFDESLLKHLIKSLGIYPPGSIVQLSNGLHGIVISVNPNKPLRPFVLLHDALADRHTPLIIDLREEPSINITVCLRPNQLPEEALQYLNPRKRISYFIDTNAMSEGQ